LGAGNENDVTVSKFFQAGNENEVTVTIFKLVGNGNDLTVTSGGNDVHLCIHAKPVRLLLKKLLFRVKFFIFCVSR
jgi:hypothetical protein